MVNGGVYIFFVYVVLVSYIFSTIFLSPCAEAGELGDHLGLGGVVVVDVEDGIIDGRGFAVQEAEGSDAEAVAVAVVLHEGVEGLLLGCHG